MKIGLESDPEGAWIDHSVYLDRTEAETVAQAAETAPIVNAAGDDITREVVTTARVITVEELGAEFGKDRVYLLMTMFRGRLNELWPRAPKSDG